MLVIGEPRSRTWEDAQGSKRHAHEVGVGGPQHVFKRLLPSAYASGSSGAEVREEARTDTRAEVPASRQQRRAPTGGAMNEVTEGLPF